MFGPEPTLIWKEVRRWLLLGVENGKLVCPRSSEYFIETAQRDIGLALEHDKQFCQLSTGFTFKSELFITSQLLISKIRNNNITSKTYLYENIKENILAENGALLKFREYKNQFNIKIGEATSSVNSLRKITRDKKIDSKNTESLVKTLKSITVQGFLTRLHDLLTNGSIIIRGVPFKPVAVPNWIDLVIHQLTEKHRMNLKEAKALISHLEQKGFDEIPTLDIRTTLSALISVYHKKEIANDHIDIMRLSTGLPISDILITDKQRKHEIVMSRLDEKYKTKVYSGTSSDIDQLIEDLKRIND